MSKKEEKTNVMRVLDQKRVPYEHFDYDNTKTSAKEICAMLAEPTDKLFKTLVTVAKSKEHYVFMVPAENELDLKKAAKAVGEKNIEMIPQKELLPLTGYIHGGCSPIGMKKQFKTVINETAAQFDTIYFSAGKVGKQVKVAPDDLAKIIPLTFADIVK